MEIKTIYKCLFALWCLAWAGNILAVDLDGSGSETDPYLIQSEEDLSNLSIDGTPENWKHYRITRDLNMQGYEFYGIGGNDGSTHGDGEFWGYFHGGGHIIKNLTIIGTSNRIGFVNLLKNGSTLDSLGLINLTINAPNYSEVGAFTGFMGKVTTSITQCYVKGGFIKCKNYGGGIVGNLNNGIVRDCFSYIKLIVENAGVNYAGGITSQVNTWGAGQTTMENVMVYGTIEVEPPDSVHHVNAVIGSETNDEEDLLNNLYYLETVGFADTNATQIALADIEDTAQYTGFDFENVWQFIDGIAALQITPEAEPAVSRAGDDQDSFEGHTITLVGTSSEIGTGGGSKLTYNWLTGTGYPDLTFDGRYVRKEWEIEDTVIVYEKTFYDTVTVTIPDFDKDTTLMIILTVNDELSVGDPDTLMVNVRSAEDNIIPTVTASADLSVQYGREVNLSASGSDDDGDSISYSWNSPEAIDIADSTSTDISFEAPYRTIDTSYVFYINTIDSPFGASSDTDSVVVEVIGNVKPLAVATADKNIVYATDFVRLSATIIDVNDDEIYYSWDADEGIILSDTSILNPGFNAPHVSEETTFEMRLVVNDGFLISDASSIFVTVKPKEGNYLPDALEALSQANINVYPNPSNGKFNVKLPVDAQLRVMDLLGDVLYTQTAVTGENSVDITMLTAGIYLLVIQDLKQQVIIKIQVQ